MFVINLMAYISLTGNIFLSIKSSIQTIKEHCYFHHKIHHFQVKIPYTIKNMA